MQSLPELSGKALYVKPALNAYPEITPPQDEAKGAAVGKSKIVSEPQMRPLYP